MSGVRGTVGQTPFAPSQSLLFGAALTTALAAGLVLWWRPREETLAGLGFGVAIGYLMGEQFRANRQRKKALQRVLGTEWHDLVEEAPECKALMRNTVYWVRRMDAESLHWINDIISALWPFNNEVRQRNNTERNSFLRAFFFGVGNRITTPTEFSRPPNVYLGACAILPSF
mmetsp:Transcript_37175/g.88370  ORF Transcript_37175/g.88370 Transcript_37175/m.88370 type:complete len:172 (-) Transcript_37175:3667-4182(-)